MKLTGNKITVIMQDGRIGFYALDADSKVFDSSYIYVTGMDPELEENSRPKYLWRGKTTSDISELGNIPEALHPGILVNNLFISSHELISIDLQRRSGVFISGYEACPKFQTAIISAKNILIGADDWGIIRYDYDFDTDSAKKTK